MILTAHSGSDGTPDNSRQFIKEMVAAGLTSMEVDVRCSDGGRLYLSHDQTPWADAMLSLENALLILKNTPVVKLTCDLKEPNLETQVLAAAEEYDLRDRIILTGAVNPEHCPTSFRKQIYYNAESIIPHLYLDWEISNSEIDRIIETCRQYGIETVNMNYRLATNNVINRFHQAGISLSLWTVNDFAEINRFKSAGIKNVTTKCAISYLYHDVIRQAMGG